MRFITLFAGTLVATTAVNILLSSDAHAGFPPNGWEQVGKSCHYCFDEDCIQNNEFHKLRKKSDDSKYGVYRNRKTWQGNTKGVTLEEADDKLLEKCNGFRI